MIKRFALVVAVAAVLAAQTTEEKRLLVTSASLERWWPGIDPKPQTFRTESNRGSFRIISEYDTRGIPRKDDDALFFLSDVEIFSTKVEAARWFKLEVAKTREGMLRVKHITVEDKDPLLTMGDDHYAGVIKYKGRTRGNLFVFRQGRVVHSLMITGLYFKKHKNVRKLFEPIYNESLRQFP